MNPWRPRTDPHSLADRTLQRDAEDADKLKVRRAAARVGVAALDRGELKEFRSIEDLQAYLNELSEKVISRAVPRP
jgi:antitoxin ParD1/3/4